MNGFSILIGFYVVGVLVERLFHIPLPANVIGLILFTAALFLKWIKLEWVEQTSQFFQKNMLLFFIPLVVGIMMFFEFLYENSISIILVMVLPALMSLALIGMIVQKLLSKRG